MIQVTLDHPAVASSSSLEKFLSVEPTTPPPLLEIQTWGAAVSSGSVGEP